MSSLDAILNEKAPVVPIEKPPPRPREGASVVTPNGWEIEFKTKPYRHYKINGTKVASVSQITGCLDKPALPWWGMKVGVEGVLELTRRGALTTEYLPNAEMDSVVALLTQEKLTVNHVKREAADRGSRVHDAMEDWALSGILPDPEGLPEDERGYILGLRAFIQEVQPEPDGVEVIVGSSVHTFAGRCDLLRCNIPRPLVAVIALDRKTGKAIRSIIPAGRYLLDLKTTTGVFQEAHFQVAGYELGSVECGYEPTDHQAIVRVTVDGLYELRESVATPEDFVAVKQAFDAMKRLEAINKDLEKKLAA